MNETERNERIPEVNLIEITRRLFNSLETFFRWLGRAILLSIVFLVRKSLWLLGFVIIGILIGYFNHRVAEKYFATEFTVLSNIEDVSNLIYMVNDLHTYCEENNTNRLEGILDLEPTVVSKIKDIEAFWIVDLINDEIPDYVDYLNDHDVSDTINPRMSDRFCVRIKGYNPADFAAIRDGIIGMICSDELVLLKNEMRLTAIRENLEVLSVQIRKLDSLENVKYFQNINNAPPDGSQMVFLQEQRTQLFYNNVFSLYEMKQEYESIIDIYGDPVSLQRDISYPIIEENTFISYSRRWVLIVAITGLFMLIIFHNRRSLREIYKTNQ